MASYKNTNRTSYLRQQCKTIFSQNKKKIQAHLHKTPLKEGKTEARAKKLFVFVRKNETFVLNSKVMPN